MVMYDIYSALPKCFCSSLASILSSASRSFRSWRLFSITSSWKERFLGFLIVFTILYHHCNSYYVRKRLQLLQLFENLIVFYSYPINSCIPHAIFTIKNTSSLYWCYFISSCICSYVMEPICFFKINPFSSIINVVGIEMIEYVCCVDPAWSSKIGKVNSFSLTNPSTLF
jgi:hypothetical protein